jgi:hypothetical protein
MVGPHSLDADVAAGVPNGLKSLEVPVHLDKGPAKHADCFDRPWNGDLGRFQRPHGIPR